MYKLFKLFFLYILKNIRNYLKKYLINYKISIFWMNLMSLKRKRIYFILGKKKNKKELNVLVDFN